MSSIDAYPISYTPAVISSQLIQALNTDQSQQAALEVQLSSGQTVNSPSDNPAAAASILQLNSTLARSQQYSNNATNGLAWLSLGTSTLNQVVSTLQSVQQAVTALSGNALGGQTAATTGALAQVRAGIQQLTNLANTTYDGQPIFAGTGNATQAYAANGTYLGGGSPPTRTVAPGTQLTIAAAGPAVFGDGTTSPALLGAGGVLQAMANDLANPTTANLADLQSTQAQALQHALGNVTEQAAQLGTNYQEMQVFSQQATSAQAALQNQLSSQDSVDVAQATTQLAQDQQSFQSALWATTQIDKNSLVQYL